MRILLAFIFLFALFARCANRPADMLTAAAEPLTADYKLTPVQLLGQKLFFDPSLSSPAGTSCASCHAQEKGFADPAGDAVSKGALKSGSGNRNAMSAAYACYTPFFRYDEAGETYVGGFFWDGRARTLAEQASGPLLNPAEMNNPDIKTVVDRVRVSGYKDLFLYIFGEGSLDEDTKAFANITDAIAAFEASPALSPFTSKYDFYLRGLAQFSEQEERGLNLFNDSLKGNCAACHPSTPDPVTGMILFTDFTYDNLGAPADSVRKNRDKNFKPDLGLGALTGKISENGKFKVPSLRNVAVTAPYFHNGVFKTLEEAVRFYNERDSGKFGKPEVEENINKEELGNLKLTEREVKDIVAFLGTLTDGYQSPLHR